MSIHNPHETPPNTKGQKGCGSNPGRYMDKNAGYRRRPSHTRRGGGVEGKPRGQKY